MIIKHSDSSWIMALLYLILYTQMQAGDYPKFYSIAFAGLFIISVIFTGINHYLEYLVKKREKQQATNRVDKRETEGK